LLQHIGGFLARGQLTVDGLGDDEAQIMGKPVCEPLTPVLRWIGIAEDRFHPDLAGCTNLNWTCRYVVCP
jgi:hypothetical protein